ncbi:nSTAND1 domain-containing NTPase [Brevibacillus sp. SAFN-007a]|uniref:nSTAND1 domain-containing NTPase n=1 Tax=Brevibacillus sp. SAFN-007a TaxID=3436862 RepID=UPI003F7F4823
MHIEVYNARLHNLKNITATIPKHQFIVVTGVSGSGKSSFIFDTLHHEGQRIYLEALGIAPEVLHYDSFDLIQGLSPTIAVQQRTVSNLNPRSVVGSVTRILNLLAILYAQQGQRAGKETALRQPEEWVPGLFMFNSPHGSCPACGGRGSVVEVNVEKILPPASEPIERWHQFAYQFPHAKKEEKEYVYKRLDNFTRHFQLSPDTPVAELPREAKEAFLHYRPKRTQSKGQLIFYGIHVVLEEKLKKINVQSFPELQTRRPCPRCQGFRLGKEALSVTIADKHIGQLCQMNAGELAAFLRQYQSARPHPPFLTHLLGEILRKLDGLETVGLSYVSLYREIPTLSGGEIQRLHIMSHISAKVDSIIYIFDEPTAGLHEKEKETIIESFHRLKQQGNTVIVVEHDESVIKHADYILDFGPLAGQLGGSLVYQGSYADFLQSRESITARYLREKKHPPKEYASVVDASAPKLSIQKARTHNLKNIDVDIPLLAIVGISGPSGSGKSSLVMDTLIPKLQSAFQAKAGKQNRLLRLLEEGEDSDAALTQADAQLTGAENIDGCIVVTQKLARRHENSCVATFLGVWDEIRQLFAATEEAIALQFTRSSFSFNSTGSCPVCHGNGQIKRWLGELTFREPCPSCDGKRFKQEVLQVRYNERTIADVLEMSIAEAHAFFRDHAKICKMLGTIEELGMGYMLIGQSLPTLSGGEAQRLKLARELGKSSKGRYLYLLDEPTVGLSYYDTEKLLVILGKLIASGHSVLLIEHDPYVLSYCDYLIELGPGAGHEGGEVIARGTPAEIKQQAGSMIGPFLT